MYIVAIAWLYVTLLMAATEKSIVGGVMTFIFYGLLPLALFLWLFNTPNRRRRNERARQESLAKHDMQPPDSADTKSDQ